MLPVSLRLTAKSVLVVGAGPVAERRIKSLLDEDATVRVVAPEVSEGVQSFARDGQVELAQRKFTEADLDGVWLVFAHTDSAEVNAEIAERCEKRRIWCLTGGDSQNSNVWMMAHRNVDENLTVAVNANGNPSRAKKVIGELTRYADEKRL